MAMKLEDKTAIVLGASGGLGSAMVKRLTDEKANVIAIGRNEDKLRQLGVRYYLCDMSDPDQVDDFLTKVKSELSDLDIFINCAGVAKYGDINALSDKAIDDAFEVNVKAPFVIIRDLLPLFEKSKGSLVINIGSGAGKIPMRGRSLYCSTKFALRGLSMSLSEEYEGKDPKFIHVALGSTLTGFGPMTLEEKKKAAENGRAYFPVSYVIDQLTDIVKDENKQIPEVVLYPSDYGFGQWKKP